MDFVRLLGVKAFATDIDPGGMEVAVRLAREYGVLLAVHNHGRRHRYGPAWALEELLASTPPEVGVCLDTAWLIDSGSDPVAFYAKHAARIYGVHVKDFVFDRTGKHADTIVGEGNLKLKDFLAALKQTNYAGFFTLEYEGDVNDPVPATRRCVEAIRRAWAELA
jgi:inosose dehydratase